MGKKKNAIDFKLEESNLQNIIKTTLKNHNFIKLFNIIRELISNRNANKSNLTDLKNLIKFSKCFLTGLSIEGYEGDYPTFIEPVFLSPGVKIGDTVLLGPNVIIGESCEIGPFCELSNVIIQKVVMGRQCKLNYCIVDENIVLPEKFYAKKCLIIKNDKGDLEKINF